VFRDDVAVTAGDGAGVLVRVRSESGAPLGWAFRSASSKIALRMVSRDEEAPGAEFWEARVADALRHREQVVRDTDAYRVVFGESDGIPGLVVDRYGPHLVVQTLTAGADRVLPAVLENLAAKSRVESVLARNDPAVRTLEGLPREIVQVRGTTPALVEVSEGPVRYLADPWRGQKTGAFLDQRENRLAAAGYVSGNVLDVFSYHGSFALHAAPRAARVEAVDSSGEALARAKENAALNGLSNVTFREANAFDDLRDRQRRGERFDAVLLDPPAFAKSRSDIAAAKRGYKEINLRAMQILAPRGVLVTSSCSYNLSEEEWLEVLAAAAADAHRSLRVLERRTQSRDHPMRLGFPESRYLKCAVLGLA
jgi:23S rRNA (cytosine1962-C5)-methyltransferase